jgi:integrase
MPSPYKHPRTGVYYLRKGVPAELRPLVGKSELKRSLHTKDTSEAKRRAARVLAEFDRTLERARRGEVHFSGEDADAIGVEQRRRRARHLQTIARRDGWTASDFDAYAAGLQEIVETDRAFDTGGERAAAAAWGTPDLRALADEHGIPVPADWQEAAAAEIYLAERDALADARFACLGDEAPPAMPDMGPPVPALSLSSLFKEYAEGKGITDKTREGWGRYIAHFEQWFGHKPARDIRRSDLYNYADHLRARGGAAGRPLNTKTINEGYIAAIRATCTWAEKRDKLAVNPSVGFHLDPTRREKSAAGVQAYEEEQVRAVLSACRQQTTAYKRWAPWLCAFTGARIKEILSARVSDLREKRGVAYLVVRTAKTEEAPRVVPIHPALIDEGFLDYAGTLPKEGYLFPGNWSDRHGDRTKTPANRLRDFINKTVSDSPDTVPLHSFRHWLIRRLRRANINHDTCRQLAGHSTADENAKYGPEDVPGLFELLSRVPSPLEPLGRSST